jgi:SAM-dependent methyltransferase
VATRAGELMSDDANTQKHRNLRNGMSLSLRRRVDVTDNELAKLERAMTLFYSKPPPEYYKTAEENAARYNPQERPFHCDLVDRLRPGLAVLELGCGSAHLCPEVESKGAHYTGVDHSHELIATNRQRFPGARFHQMNEPLSDSFDVVASLYTIEHVADPKQYLDKMRRHCKPGGLLAVICPEFVDSEGFPPSLFFGTTPRRLRDKLSTGSFLDAGRHIFDFKVAGPLWKRAARNSVPGAFWINLKPRILYGATYCIDADAIHFSRLKDLKWYFEQKGDVIVHTSERMHGVSSDILRFNCYLLAEKVDE